MKYFAFLLLCGSAFAQGIDVPKWPSGKPDTDGVYISGEFRVPKAWKYKVIRPVHTRAVTTTEAFQSLAMSARSYGGNAVIFPRTYKAKDGWVDVTAFIVRFADVRLLQNDRGRFAVY